MHRLLDGGLRVGSWRQADSAPRSRAPRGWQLDEPIGLHAQHSDPAGHLFQRAIGLVPVQRLAGQSEEIGAGARGVLCNQPADEYPLGRGEVSATVAPHDMLD